MNRLRKRKYKRALDTLYGDVGTGGAPSAPMDYGPSLSSGTVYTDSATIKAVQQALTSHGYSPGKADGVFGPNTEAALFKFSGKHGPPDDDTLASLGVTPGGSSSAPVARSYTSSGPMASKSYASSMTPAAAKGPGRSVAPESESFLTSPVPGIGLPVWQVVLGALGVTAIGVGVYKAFSRR